MCWLPTQFSDEQADYTHQLCWVNNTYYYPGVHDADIFPESRKNTLLYYQYILFILFGQALLFYLPTMAWNLLAGNSIGYIKKILDQCQKSNTPKVVPTPAKHEPKPKITSHNEYDLNMRAVPIQDEERSKSQETLDEMIETENPETVGEIFQPLLLDKDFSQKFVNEFKSIMSMENEETEQQDQPSVNENENEPFKDDSNQNEHFKFDESQKGNDANADLFKKVTNAELKSEQTGFISKSLKKIESTRRTKILSFMKPIMGAENLARNYILLKFLNLINVVIQMCLLHFVFGNRFYRYGWDFVISLFKSENPFFTTTHFPIMTFCDFHVYQNLRKIYYNTAQCVLPINVLIEKFFLIIWFWYCLLIVLTVINIFVWLFEFVPGRKIEFLSKYLDIRVKMENERRKWSSTDNRASIAKNANSHLQTENVKGFYNNYLHIDGLIMLHLIKSVAGGIVFMELLGLLWIDFRIEHFKHKKQTILRQY